MQIFVDGRKLIFWAYLNRSVSQILYFLDMSFPLKKELKRVRKNASSFGALNLI